MKKIVAYFSASGVTKAVAGNLAEAVNADLFEIIPETPYTKADLNWSNKKSRSSVEMQDPASRPPIANKIANIKDYDVVFLGFPIWWYVAPSIINTFLESYDFSGKIIVPFCTSGSSGVGKTAEGLKARCPSSVKWRPAKLLNGRVSKEQLTDWVNSLDV